MKAPQCANGQLPDALTIWDSPALMHQAMAVLEREQETTPRTLAVRIGVRLQQASDTLRYLVYAGCAERVRPAVPGVAGSSAYRPAP